MVKRRVLGEDGVMSVIDLPEAPKEIKVELPSESSDFAEESHDELDGSDVERDESPKPSSGEVIIVGTPKLENVVEVEVPEPTITIEDRKKAILAHAEKMGVKVGKQWNKKKIIAAIELAESEEL